MFKSIGTALWLLLITTVSNSQSIFYEFERFSIDDGLSQSTVYCAIQDFQGYLWFGTSDGLNRFDGHQFTVFIHNPQDSTSISYNRIMALFEDSEHNLWIGTVGGGLNLYNRETNRFSVYKNNPDDSTSIGDNRVMSIAEDSEGDIWVGASEGGISVLDKKTNKFRRYKHNPENPSSISGNLIRAIHLAPDGSIYVGTDRGVCIFEKNTNTFRCLNNIDKLKNQLPFFAVRKIVTDSKGNMWFTIENNGLAIVNTDLSRTEWILPISNQNNSLASNIVMDILIENDTTIWLATYNGLQIYNPKKNQFITFSHNPADPFSISDNLLRFIIKDNSGTFWIGTYSSGICKLNYHNVKFPVFRNQFDRKNQLPYAPVRALFEASDNSVWIGTYGKGLVRFMPKTGEIDNNPIPKHVLKGLDVNYITCIAEDSNGHFWFGTNEMGLIEYNPETKKCQLFRHQPNRKGSLPDNRIRCLFIDEYRTLWIGTSGGGFCSFMPENNTFRSFRHRADNPQNSLSEDRVLTITGTSGNILWIGTSNGGLNKFNKVTESFTHYKTTSSMQNPISSNRVYSLLTDSKGRMWVGTHEGLNLFDLAKESFRTFRKSDGLPNEVIYGILEDGNGNLWFSTNMGLCSFRYVEEGEHTIKVYTKTDGLQSNEFNEGAFLKLRSGSMIFGGISGINIFNPDNLPLNKVPPTINIGKIAWYKQGAKSGSKNYYEQYHATHLNLPYQFNNLSLEYDVLHYQNPNGNNVQYKLDGFESDWTNQEPGKRTVQYANLPSGNYVFQVRASNSDGVWNTIEDSITINIKKPYWFEWWFWAVTALSLFLIIRIIIKIRLRSLILAKNQLEETVKLRTIEIQQQKNELETQSEILRQANEELLAQRSELEYAQSALIQSEKMASLGILTAGIAHEINNPVNFVYAGSNILKRDFEDIKHVVERLSVLDDETISAEEKINAVKNAMKEVNITESFEAAEQTIKDISLGAVRAAEIVDGLKSFARGDTSEWVMYDLNKAIDGVLTLLKNNYKNRIEIEKDLDKSLPLVESKGGKINQVIMNIISNAIDAIVGNGTIWIRTSHNDTNATISIKDNGSGIPERIKNKIFDPFFTTKDIGKGTGLGLSISYGIVNEHYGTIEVVSKIGEGTEFIITLPLKQDKS